MRWRQDLQVKVRERYRRLYSAGGESLAQEIDLVAAWLSQQPALMYEIEEARLREVPPDPQEWLAAEARRGRWDWPTATEAGRAVFSWDLLRYISSSAPAINQWAFVLSSAQTMEEAARDVVQRIFQPLFDYLGEQIGDGSSILYIPGALCPPNGMVRPRQIAR